MCLATYGQIKKIYDRNGFLVGEIDFAGLLKEIDLALAPDSKVGDYIVAHGDFAVRQMDAAEAKETLEILKNSCAHHNQQ